MKAVTAVQPGGSFNLLASTEVSTPLKSGKENCAGANVASPGAQQQQQPVVACTPTKTRKAICHGYSAASGALASHGGLVDGTRSQHDGGSSHVTVKNTFVHLSPEKVKSAIATPPRTAPSSFRVSGGHFLSAEGLRVATGGTTTTTTVSGAGHVATPGWPSPLRPSPVAPTPEVHGALRTPGPFSDFFVSSYHAGATLQATKVLRLSDHLTSPAVVGQGQQPGLPGCSPQARGATARMCPGQAVGQVAPVQAGVEFPSVPPLPQTLPQGFMTQGGECCPSQYGWQPLPETGFDCCGTHMASYSSGLMQLPPMQRGHAEMSQTHMGLQYLTQQESQQPPLFPMPSSSSATHLQHSHAHSQQQQQIPPPAPTLPAVYQHSAPSTSPQLTTDVVTVMSTAFSGHSLLAPPPPLAAPPRVPPTSLLHRAAAPPTSAPVAPPPPLPPQLSPVFNGKVSISVDHFPEPGSTLQAQVSPPPPARSPLVDLGGDDPAVSGAAKELAMRERCAGLRGELWLN